MSNRISSLRGLTPWAAPAPSRQERATKPSLPTFMGVDVNAQRLPVSEQNMRLYQELMGSGDVSQMVEQARARLNAPG